MSDRTLRIQPRQSLSALSGAATIKALNNTLALAIGLSHNSRHRYKDDTEAGKVEIAGIRVSGIRVSTGYISSSGTSLKSSYGRGFTSLPTRMGIFRSVPPRRAAAKRGRTSLNGRPRPRTGTDLDDPNRLGVPTRVCYCATRLVGGFGRTTDGPTSVVLAPILVPSLAVPMPEDPGPSA